MAADTRDPNSNRPDVSSLDPTQRGPRDATRSSDHPDTESPRLFRPQESEESDRPKRKAKPRHPDLPESQVGKLWAALGDPKDSANQIPGGTYNSAGGKPKEVSLWETLTTTGRDWKTGLGTVKPDDFKNIHRVPCARDGLLYGIGAGFGLGGMRAIVGGSVWASCSWAVYSFTLTAGVLYARCQSGLQNEKKSMIKAVELMQSRQMEQAKREREAAQRKAEEERLAEDARRRKSWTHLPNYKFW